MNGRSVADIRIMATPAIDHGFFVYPAMSESFIGFMKRCMPFTMTTSERQFALHKAVQYIARAGIEGDYVECGVWRGGASMMAALTLAEAGQAHRNIWLYDTFAGMSRPTEVDRRTKSATPAMVKWSELQREGFNEWCFAPIDQVRANMSLTGYPAERIRYVQGMVEDTIPATLPSRIALLRLDTDFYESTMHEMRHLYPLLAPGGVLIVDDYGVWEGARAAVDEYFASIGEPMLLTSVDITGVVAVKPANSRATARAAA